MVAARNITRRRNDIVWPAILFQLDGQAAAARPAQMDEDKPVSVRNDHCEADVQPNQSLSHDISENSKCSVVRTLSHFPDCEVKPEMLERLTPSGNVSLRDQTTVLNKSRNALATNSPIGVMMQPNGAAEHSSQAGRNLFPSDSRLLSGGKSLFHH